MCFLSFRGIAAIEEFFFSTGAKTKDEEDEEN